MKRAQCHLKERIDGFQDLDDRYENGAHDYLKYIKFGYSRATDHACKDIRTGYLSREEGIERVNSTTMSDRLTLTFGSST